MRHETPHDGRLAVEVDAEAVAHPAGSAVATDEVTAPNLLDIATRAADHRGHRFIVLHQIDQCHLPPSVHQRSIRETALKNRLDLHLGNTHRRLAGHAAVVALADPAAPFGHARIAEAMQLVTAQRGDPGDIEVVILRYRDAAQLVRQPEATKQLHAAGVGDVHLGMTGRGCVPFDQHASDAALRQIAGERHADRSATGDEHRHLFHRDLRSSSRGSCSRGTRARVVPASRSRLQRVGTPRSADPSDQPAGARADQLQPWSRVEGAHQQVHRDHSAERR